MLPTINPATCISFPIYYKLIYINLSLHFQIATNKNWFLIYCKYLHSMVKWLHHFIVSIQSNLNTTAHSQQQALKYRPLTSLTVEHFMLFSVFPQSHLSIPFCNIRVWIWSSDIDFFLAGESMNTVSHYHKWFSQVSHIRRNHSNQLTQSAMGSLALGNHLLIHSVSPARDLQLKTL